MFILLDALSQSEAEERQGTAERDRIQQKKEIAFFLLSLPHSALFCFCLFHSAFMLTSPLCVIL